MHKVYEIIKVKSYANIHTVRSCTKVMQILHVKILYSRITQKNVVMHINCVMYPNVLRFKAWMIMMNAYQFIIDLSESKESTSSWKQNIYSHWRTHDYWVGGQVFLLFIVCSFFLSGVRAIGLLKKIRSLNKYFANIAGAAPRPRGTATAY